MGVNSGDYDAGAVASDVFHRMAERGQVKEVRFPHHLSQPEIPDLVVRLRARSRAAAGRQDAELLLRLSLPARDAKGVRRRRSLLPDQLQDDMGGGARRREGLGRRLRQGDLRQGNRARSAKREEAAAARRRSDRRLRRRAPLSASGALLSKSYVAGKPVLRDIDLDIAARGITAIIGPSGTGKSTLIRCINRLVEPTSGAIEFEGDDLVALAAAAAAPARAAASAWCSRNTTWSSG